MCMYICALACVCMCYVRLMLSVSARACLLARNDDINNKTILFFQ